MSFTFEEYLLPNNIHKYNCELPKKGLSTSSVPEVFRQKENAISGLNNTKSNIGKALTDTSSFIPLGNLDSLCENDMKYRDMYSNERSRAKYKCDENDEDRASLVLSLACDDLVISEEVRKRHEKWADKGSAKVVKEILNPETGKVVKHVVKKGIKDFKFGKILGDGSYSTVMLATSKDSGKKYAVKVLNKEYLVKQKKVKYVNIEKNTLQRLNNSHCIIKLYFTFQDESSLYFLLEYAPNGDFLSVMKKFGSLSESCSCYYSAQILDAIEFLHHQGVIHRDIKPENILLDALMKIKLTDFGTAKLLDKDTNNSYNLLTRSKSFVGTAEYVSPELLNDNYVDYKCDIWAFGCILFQMIAGKPPFKATNEYLTFQKVMKIQYAFTAGFPLIIRDLVKQILVKDPDQRPNIQQIKEHHFFKEVNFKDNSVWEKLPPDIAPYKVTAKAMQPVVELKENKPTRTTIVLPKRNLSKTVVSKSQSISTNDDSQLQECNINPTKRDIDPRTVQILEAAKREINTRKQQQKQKQIKRSQNAVSAAAVALYAKKPISSSLSPCPKSSPSTASHSILKPQSAPTSHVKNFSKPSPSTFMGKIDILWSYYLTNLDERVVRMGEINIAITRAQSLEKKVERMNVTSLETKKAQRRTTLLSQVARGGGNITGFRTDSNTNYMKESDYYLEYEIYSDSIVDSYKKSDYSENDHEHISNIFKKLFLQKTDESPDLTLQSEYLKKTVVITTFGRCLIFVKRHKAHPHTNLFFDLEYDINLSQNGVKLKELSIDISDIPPSDVYNILAIQTPFKCFLFRCDRSDFSLWMNAINKSTRKNHERLTIINQDHELSETAAKAARLSTPSLQNTEGNKSITITPQSSPKFNLNTFTTTTSPSKTNTTKISSIKHEMLFNSFINNKEKYRRPARPVPLSSKLVNGLPTMSLSINHGTSPDYA